ncbi:MAG TPA: peptidylprolyl isomerase [Acidobacteriota bacterium]|nr:peptidylprolyl isomerase [Acidobacteriota bacterium]
MRSSRSLCLLGFLLAACLAPSALLAQNPVVTVDTTLGRFSIELYADKAPETVENFLAYVEDGHFDGTIFHRVIPGFIIQGGGLTPDLKEKPTRPPIPNEADNGLKNEVGTVAMARTSEPHSAQSQFYVNLNDNTALDHHDKSVQGWGYAVFGRVTSGMEVVRTIASVPSVTRAGHHHVPVTPIEITKVWLQK